MAATYKETVKQIYEAMNSNNFSGLENYVDADMTEHSPDPFAPADKKGPEYIKAVMETYKKAFPDLKIRVLDLIEEGDKLAAHVELTGTHSGYLMEKAPTNKCFKAEGIDLVKFTNGKVTDHWGVWDYASIMQQLGIGGQ